MNGACAALPAACGELVQGTLDGMPCLVSCPIDRYASARVELEAPSARAPSHQSWSLPPDAPKSVAALFSGLRHLGADGSCGSLQLSSAIPRSRGYASSTADVGATLYALAEALGCPLHVREVAQLAVSVEPTDSTLFPGLSLFAHRDGRLWMPLGPAPPLDVIVLDPGGAIDTLAFNRVDHGDALRRLAPQHREAFHLLLDGLKRRNWWDVGEAATLSSRAHQAILPNPLLDAALNAADAVGALGVCRAHSGTVLGLLFERRDLAPEDTMKCISRSLPPAVPVAHCRLVAGGPRSIDEKQCRDQQPFPCLTRSRCSV